MIEALERLFRSLRLARLETQLDPIPTNGTRASIIDSRDNEGGLGCGKPILARLVEPTVAPVRTARRVRARRVPDDLKQHVDTRNKSFYDCDDRATEPHAVVCYDLI